jgi:hypothetical protein
MILGRWPDSNACRHNTTRLIQPTVRTRVKNLLCGNFQPLFRRRSFLFYTIIYLSLQPFYHSSEIVLALSIASDQDPTRLIRMHSLKISSATPPPQDIARSIVEKSLNRTSSDPHQPEKYLILGTDIEEDIDDAVLRSIYGYLHKKKVIEVLLVVVNLEPRKRRMIKAESIFKNMGAPEIPVACGTAGTGMKRSFNCYEHGMEELDGTVMNGRTATVEVLMGLLKLNQRCNILVISSLRDLDDLTSEHGDLVRETFSSFFFQGKWETSSVTQQLRTLFPDDMAQNYSYDFEAATRVHQWLRNENIPTYTATRHSAIRAAINPHIVREAAE